MTLRKQENLVYTIIWTALFLIPITGWLKGTLQGGSKEVLIDLLRGWKVLIPLLVLFIIHNSLIIPVLTRKGKDKKYLLYLGVLMAVFCTCAFVFNKGKGPHPGGPGRNAMEMRDPRGPRPPEMDRMNAMPPGKKPNKAPIRPLRPEIMAILEGLLVIGGNLAIAQFFKSLQRERDIEELEKDILEGQLRSLRYQISPHFFMNTLNNIHALVDIDPEKAKDSIVQLSKLMRYMLYEGEKPTIPLEKEINFLSQYVSLMRLRYNDSIDIKFSVPDVIPDTQIPALLFISFVENAFKHGISYQHESFIDISIKQEDGRLLFICSNSRQEEKDDEGKQGGIGVGNSKRRLDLIYGENYTMDISYNDNVYTISVNIPI